MAMTAPASASSQRLSAVQDNEEMRQAIASLESSSYPADEAASAEQIGYRVTHAGDFFRTWMKGEQVIGFVNGTATFGNTLTEESMSTHESDGTTLCIHSVCVHPEYRRQGIATRMLQAYLAQLPAQVEIVLLMTKKTLIPFYSKCGFKLVGKSAVVHGKDPWFEMIRLTTAPKGATKIIEATKAKQGSEKRQFGVTVADMHCVPALAVFDLDACFWDEEMYRLDHMVDRKNPEMGPLGDAGDDGIIGARSGHSIIRLNPGALLALQEFYRGSYPGMRIAAASSADTPQAVRIGRSALNLLEIVPGVTARQVFNIGWPEGFEGNMQIGRTAPLSSNKAKTHFPFIKKATKVIMCILT